MVRVMTSINGDTLIYKEILIFVSQKLPEAFGLSPEQKTKNDSGALTNEPLEKSCPWEHWLY